MSAPFRFPKFFVTNPSPCPYLPGKVERKVFTELSGRHASELNEALGRIGFRRSQSVAYRPSCIDCSACVSVRVLASEFIASATQRKLLRRHADLEVTACKPWTTEEQYSLLRRYLAARHPGGGMAEMDESDFADMVEQTPVRTYLIEYREPSVDGKPGKLVGACLSDQQSDGLSMIYSFFDVGEDTRKGLGTFIILDHIIRAARAGLPYVYLGYWVQGSSRMAYKTSFRPLERLGRDGWRRMEEAEVDDNAPSLPLDLPVRPDRKRELVEEERWIEPARFNRLLAIYQVLPGPEAHELCVHFGMMKGGRLGGLLAGLGFMAPGLILVLALAWLYQRLDLDQPMLAALFLGVQIGVIALIVRAVHRIADHALTRPWLWAIAMASAAVAILWPSSETPANTAGAATAAGALALFWSGLKAGLLTFGGAYTAIPFVRSDAVGRGWVSEGQFLDSLAFSGVIPAPLIIFATFVGYLAGGLAGALAITAGIFLPAFAMTLLFYDRLERVIENERLHRLLEGVAAGVVGLIAVTAVQLGWNVARAVPSLPFGAAIFAGALTSLYVWRSKAGVPVVMLGSASAGMLFLA